MGEMVWKSRKQFYKKCKVRWACVSNALCRGELIGAFRDSGWCTSVLHRFVFSVRGYFCMEKNKGNEKAVCRVWCLLELCLILMFLSTPNNIAWIEQIVRETAKYVLRHLKVTCVLPYKSTQNLAQSIWYGLTPTALADRKSKHRERTDKTVLFNIFQENIKELGNYYSKVM